MNLPRWFAAVVARPRVSRVALAIATVVDRPLLRLSGGRLRLSFIVPVLLLRCRGARSGLLREVPLLYCEDESGWILVGSNGGRERLPAWVHNLRARPDVSVLVQGRAVDCSAQELAGDERARALARAIDVYPGYTQYCERLQRSLPLFRLVPNDPARKA